MNHDIFEVILEIQIKFHRQSIPFWEFTHTHTHTLFFFLVGNSIGLYYTFNMVQRETPKGRESQSKTQINYLHTRPVKITFLQAS